MEDLLSLVVKYGWQIALLGIFGSVLIGLIKTPIRTLVFKNITDEDKIKKTENIFDTSVFIGTFVLAVIISISYLAIIKDLTWAAVVGTSVQMWLVQSVVYGVWKKLGLKRLFALVISAVKAALVKRADADGDGRVSFSEAVGSIQELVSNGKIDLNKVLELAEAAVPGIAEEVLYKITEEAGEAAQIDPAAEIERLTNTLKEATASTVGAIKKKTPDAIDPIVDIAGNSLEEVISNIPTVKF